MTPILEDKELQHMRDAVNALYPDTCNLLTVTQVSDSAGGFTDTWGTADAGVACRLDIVNGQERLTDGSLRSLNFYELSFPYDTTITEAYRVEIGDSTYLVSAVPTDQSWQIERMVRIERI